MVVGGGCGWITILFCGSVIGKGILGKPRLVRNLFGGKHSTGWRRRVYRENFFVQSSLLHHYSRTTNFGKAKRSGALSGSICPHLGSLSSKFSNSIIKWVPSVQIRNWGWGRSKTTIRNIPRFGQRVRCVWRNKEITPKGDDVKLIMVKACAGSKPPGVWSHECETWQLRRRGLT